MDMTIVRCAWCDSLGEATRPLTPCPACGHQLGISTAGCRCHQCYVKPLPNLNQSKPDKAPAELLAGPPVSRSYGQMFWLRLPDGHVAQLWLSEPDYDTAAAMARVLAFAPSTLGRLKALLDRIGAGSMLAGAAAEVSGAHEAVADAEGRK